ncbi:hypothetical protein ACTXT7_017395 [Hymenolepis weldensis]
MAVVGQSEFSTYRIWSFALFRPWLFPPLSFVPYPFVPTLELQCFVASLAKDSPPNLDSSSFALLFSSLILLQLSSAPVVQRNCQNAVASCWPPGRFRAAGGSRRH